MVGLLRRGGTARLPPLRPSWLYDSAVTVDLDFVNQRYWWLNQERGASAWTISSGGVTFDANGMLSNVIGGQNYRYIGDMGVLQSAGTWGIAVVALGDPATSQDTVIAMQETGGEICNTRMFHSTAGVITYRFYNNAAVLHTGDVTLDPAVPSQVGIAHSYANNASYINFNNGAASGSDVTFANNGENPGEIRLGGRQLAIKRILYWPTAQGQAAAAALAGVMQTI